MTVVLRHSKTLNLNVVECSGVVATAQLGALAACAAQNPVLLEADTLNIVRPGADLSSVDLRELGALFAHYQKLYAPLQFEVYRRTAWVCQSPSAVAHVAFWTREQEARKPSPPMRAAWTRWPKPPTGCCSAPKRARCSNAAKASPNSRDSTIRRRLLLRRVNA